MLRAHRILLDTWEQHGIPDDPETRRFALEELLPETWTECKRLDALSKDLIDELRRHEEDR